MARSSSATTRVPAAEQILVDGQRPDWVGPPILETDDVGVYPVVPDAGDPRCADRAATAGRSPAPRGVADARSRVFAVALAVRVVTASIIGFPKPEDTAYYVGVARNLVEGRGLVSDALWSYGTPPLVFPRPAFEVWLPLPSLLAAIPIALFGGPAPIPLDAAMRAAQVIPVLAGAILSVLAWRLAADVAAGARAARRPGADARARDGPRVARSTCRSSSTRRCPTRRCCSARSSSARACS